MTGGFHSASLVGLQAGLDDRERRTRSSSCSSTSACGCRSRCWALARAVRQRRREEQLLLGPALAIFGALFVVRMAPWEWDNTKLMLWCYLVTLPPIETLVLARLRVCRARRGRSSCSSSRARSAWSRPRSRRGRGSRSSTRRSTRRSARRSPASAATSAWRRRRPTTIPSRSAASRSSPATPVISGATASTPAAWSATWRVCSRATTDWVALAHAARRAVRVLGRARAAGLPALEAAVGGAAGGRSGSWGALYRLP